MLRFTFKRGLRLMTGIKEWELQRKLPNGNLYFESDDGDALNVSQKEFYKHYLSKEWEIVESSLRQEDRSFYNVTTRDLATFSIAMQKRAQRKLNYLNAIAAIGKFNSTPAELKPQILEVARQLEDEAPPSPTTVYRWFKKFRDGKSVVSLIDRNETKGRRPNMSHEVQEILQEAIDTIYLNLQRYPVKDIFKKVTRDIGRINANRSAEDQLTPPSRASVYRHVNKIEAYSVAVARLGRLEADKQFRSITGTQETDRLLERWEIDHTPLDIILVTYLDDGMHTIGRPWISVILDKYSRMVMGFYISFHTPSAQSVIMCLKHAILPKQEFIDQFEGIKSTWPAHGLPENLICDNGMDLHASAVVKVCQELNIQLQFCPAKEPKYKGAIERFFRRINEELIHTLPGTVFSNPKQRGDYESERKACVDLQTLTQIIMKWIVDIYHHTPHRTLKQTPYLKWKEGEGRHTGIEMPHDPDMLSVIMGIPKQRTLFHYGVEINGLLYNSETLQLMRKKSGLKLVVDVKYYEDNLGFIHVFDDVHKEYMSVPAIKIKYAKGLSLEQHEVINRLLNERNVADDNDLYAMREQIKGLICRAQKAKKMAQRKKATVLLGNDSNLNQHKEESAQEFIENELDPSTNTALLAQELPKFNIVKRRNNALVTSGRNESSK